MDSFYKPIQRPWEEAHGTPNSLNSEQLQTSNLGEFTNLVVNHPYTQSMAGENNIATQILNLRNGGSINLEDSTGTVDFGLGTIGINPNDSDFSGRVNFRDPNRPSATVSHSGTGLSLTGTGGLDPSAYIGFNKEADRLLSQEVIDNQTTSAINEGLGVSTEVTNAIQSEAVRRKINDLLIKPMLPRPNPNSGQTDAVRQELEDILPRVKLFP